MVCLGRRRVTVSSIRPESTRPGLEHAPKGRDLATHGLVPKATGEVDPSGAP